MNLNNRNGASKCLDYVLSLSRKLKSFQDYEIKANIQIHNNFMSYLKEQHFLQTLKMDATIQKYKDIVRSFDDDDVLNHQRHQHHCHQKPTSPKTTTTTTTTSTSNTTHLSSSPPPPPPPPQRASTQSNDVIKKNSTTHDDAITQQSKNSAAAAAAADTITTDNNSIDSRFSRLRDMLRRVLTTRNNLDKKKKTL